MIDRRMLQHGDHRPHVYMLLQIMRSLTLHALQIMLRRGDHGPLAGGDHGPLYFLHAYRVRQVITIAKHTMKQPNSIKQSSGARSTILAYRYNCRSHNSYCSQGHDALQSTHGNLSSPNGWVVEHLGKMAKTVARTNTGSYLSTIPMQWHLPGAPCHTQTLCHPTTSCLLPPDATPLMHDADTRGGSGPFRLIIMIN